MMNFFKTKTKNEKIIQEVDKNIAEIEKYVDCLIDTTKGESQKQKFVSIISKDLDIIYKTLFDSKYFNLELFEYFIEKNLINMLTSYIGLQNIELMKVVVQMIEKILYESYEILTKIEISEEIIWMNNSSVNSMKILIHTFNSVLSHIPFDEELISCLINLMFKFLNKLIMFPNYYYAIASSGVANTSEYLDSAIFELIIKIFSFEHLIQSRETKAKIRKTLLFSLNLENFYTISISYIERLIECLVENLINYYELYKIFEPEKYEKSLTINNKQIQVILKKEKISNEDFVSLQVSDLISYLKYFSILLHCFTQLDIKRHLANLLFNNLLISHCQKDILNIYMIYDSEKKMKKICEFLYYFTKYIRHKETSQVIFYFFFGLNLYNQTTEFHLNDDLENGCEEDKLDYDELFPCEENLINLSKINIEKLIKNNFSNKFSLSLNINRSSHKFENILSFFMSVIESTHQMSGLKIIFFNIMTNIVRNTSNLFLSEILVPYYLNFIHSQTKNFENFYEKLKSSRETIEISQLVKNIIPKYIPLDLEDSFIYFETNLENNFKRNIAMLNLLESENLLDCEDFNNLNDENLSDNFFLENNLQSSDFKKRNNSSLDIEFETSPNSGEKNREETKGLSINLNNSIYATRIRFYDTLVRCFKNFITNPYSENLHITAFFSEVFSLPYMGHKYDELYNIYSNVNFAGKKKFIVYNLSSVNLLHYIAFKIDEIIKSKYSRDEILKLIYSRNNENLPNPSPRASSLQKKSINTQEDFLFIDNLILFVEFIKEFISNVFTKSHFDQINFNYAKAISELK
jgi:hypothetical protein